MISEGDSRDQQNVDPLTTPTWCSDPPPPSNISPVAIKVTQPCRDAVMETPSKAQEPLDSLSMPTWSLDPLSPSSTPAIVTTPSKQRKKVTVIISSSTDSESTFKVTAAKNTSESTEGSLSPSSDFHFDKSSKQSRLSLHSVDSEDATWEPKLQILPNGFRRLSCRTCKRKFVRKSAFHLHQYREHRLLPIACEEEGCTQRFANLSDLFKHRIIHDPDCRCPCPECDRFFISTHALKIHLRTHNRMTYKCEDCGLTFHRITAFTRHRRNRHPKLKKQVNLEPEVLSKKQMERMDAQLASLPVIMPKPPPNSRPAKLPIPRLHPVSRSIEKVPTSPNVPPASTPPTAASFINSFPVANFVPIYCSQPPGVSDNGSDNQVSSQIYAIHPNGYSQTTYENFYPTDSPYCVSPSDQEVDMSGSNNVFPVDLNAGFPMPPAEIVDLNTYPEISAEVSDLPDFSWSNSNSYSAEQSQNWLQPISLFTDNQQEAEIIHMVEETFQGDPTTNL
ncbi:zinc finger C2H2 type [Echinococcus multilocularis]|uniref:Zinc finger C2H2 type n=1 Tax=Echinococcus multilocularis TaxID=6211 RepID=A0A068XWI2_ECHMU|nr:zinc finger C2H2 type [Echinococcus multilocularis]